MRADYVRKVRCTLLMNSLINVAHQQPADNRFRTKLECRAYPRLRRKSSENVPASRRTWIAGRCINPLLMCILMLRAVEEQPADWLASRRCCGIRCLCTAYNGELMRSLQERDELHMAQDSMLVDIDDLIRSEHFLIAPVCDFYTQVYLNEM